MSVQCDHVALPAILAPTIGVLGIEAVGIKSKDEE